MPADTPREHPRYALEVAVDIQAGDRSMAARSSNVSRGGFCVHMSEPLAPGTELTATLALVFDGDSTSEPLELPARVVWCTPLDDDEYQIGTAFLPLTGSQLQYIDMFLRYLVPNPADADANNDDDTSDDPFAT